MRLAYLHEKLHRFVRAEMMWDQALKACELLLGPDHIRIAVIIKEKYRVSVCRNIKSGPSLQALLERAIDLLVRKEPTQEVMMLLADINLQYASLRAEDVSHDTACLHEIWCKAHEDNST